eukprot:Tbor_TRINITY_DN4727_c1_g1::TRINITY_DN4727_c1_g1_i6::g.16891::m.16891
MSHSDRMLISDLFPKGTRFVSITDHYPTHSTSLTFPLGSRRERSSTGSLETDSNPTVTLPRRQLRDSYTPFFILLLLFTIICSILSCYRCPRDNWDFCIPSAGTGSNDGIFIFGCAAGDVVPISVPRTSPCSKLSLSSISIHPITDENSRLLTFGLVADSHYDTFPAGEKAPWQSLNNWYKHQRDQITLGDGRRYDLNKDKMQEVVDVFNKLYDGDKMTSELKQHAKSETEGRIYGRLSGNESRRMDLVVNLGDLINNNGMRNLKTIMDIFNEIKAPHYHILGNHDLRGHNDRFGKVNKYQHAWIRHHMLNNGMPNDNGHIQGGTDRNNSTMDDENHRWFFSIRYPPFFRFIFVDSMVMEPKSPDKQKTEDHILWIKRELQAVRETKHEVVILFAHIPIGLATNVMGPTLKEYDDIILAFFHGHDHEGGYTKQGNVHSIIIQGQIQGLVNAYAVVEVFPNRLEVTGFGRVTTRVLPFESKEALARLHHATDEIQRAVKGLVQHPPINSNGHPTISGPWWESVPAGDAGSMNKECYKRPDLRYTYAEPLFPSVSNNESNKSRQRLLFRPLPSHLMWKGINSKESELERDSGGSTSDSGTKPEKELKKFPPLLLNIPNYRKPLIPYVEPSPGTTLLLTEVYNKWPKRVRKRTVSEAPVHLNDGSPHQRPVWLVNNTVNSNFTTVSSNGGRDSGGGKVDGGISNTVPRAATVKDSDKRGDHITSSLESRVHRENFTPVGIYIYNGEVTTVYDLAVVSFLIFLITIALLIVIFRRFRPFYKARKYFGSRL